MVGGLPGFGPTAAAPGSEAESCGAGQTQTQTGCGETYIDTEANADAYSDTRAGFYPAGGSVRQVTQLLSGGAP